MAGSARQCRTIFDDAIERPVVDREGFLLLACGRDEVLLGEVRQLLAAHDRLGTFLERPSIWNTSEPDPVQVGGYHIQRKIGEGGMGRVYLAEPGPVAIKLIRRDVAPETVGRRFERERGLLARLDHPCISRLLDGGITSDGTPYLVLSYVPGVALDLFCAQRSMGVRNRLGLFSSVCDAVAFAHGQLVVHRDLKPANILVREDGTPVVLDFGLARLIDLPLGQALDSTRTGHRLLTPEYASPEQVRGSRATPAVDVYALGVILYELLSGVRPHRFQTWSMAEIVRVVCDDPMPPPSAALHRARLQSERWPIRDGDIQPALDAIVMRALAKKASERYAHVAHLQADVRRHLSATCT